MVDFYRCGLIGIIHRSTKCFDQIQILFLHYVTNDNEWVVPLAVPFIHQKGKLWYKLNLLTKVAKMFRQVLGSLTSEL